MKVQEKRKKVVRLVFLSSTKREFSATTTKKCTKKLDARAKLLFC